jgi:hypothetical protein
MRRVVFFHDMIPCLTLDNNNKTIIPGEPVRRQTKTPKKSSDGVVHVPFGLQIAAGADHTDRSYPIERTKVCGTWRHVKNYSIVSGRMFQSGEESSSGKAKQTIKFSPEEYEILVVAVVAAVATLRTASHERNIIPLHLLHGSVQATLHHLQLL